MAIRDPNLKKIIKKKNKPELIKLLTNRRIDCINIYTA